LKNIRTWLCAAALALSGCASNVTLSPDASGKGGGLAPEEGAVAFRVTTTQLGINQFFAYWNIAEVGRVKAGDDLLKYEIGYERAGALGSATYFGKLPPGRYYISKFDSTQCGAMCITAKLFLPFEQRQFTVTKGQVTYLGNIVHQPLGGTAVRVAAPENVNPDEFRDWLKAFRPDLEKYPVVAQTLAPTVSDAMYQGTLAAGAGLLHPTAIGGDSVLFSSQAGGLRQWTTSGIRYIPSGSPSMIHAVLPLTDRRWLVGGDFKVLRQTDDAGRSWRDVPVNLPYGAIRELFRNTRGQTVVVVERPNEVLVYAGDLVSDVWTRVFAQEYVFDFWRGVVRSPIVSLTGSDLLLALPDGKGALIDIDALQATSFEFPGGLMSAAYTADGALRCRCNKSGFWVNPWISRDRGKTWAEDTIDRGMALPQFRDKRFGLATLGPEIMVTRDGGATWASAHKIERPYMPSPLAPMAMSYTFLGSSTIVASDGAANVLRSDDGGTTWKHEWPRTKN
jgi:hypothetical protein